MNQLSTAYAPPFKIIVKYFGAAVLSFLILNTLLVFNYDSFRGHHFQPKLLALTHIATLGWITMTIFGALFQLIPVVLQVKLFSEKLAEIQFWVFTLGVFTLVFSFWFFMIDTPLIIGAALLNLAILIFIVNVVVTFTRVKEWNLTATYLTAALFYLLITGIFGLYLAINLTHPIFETSHLIYLGYHVNIAVVGWVGMVIMGVTFKLIPMFTLSHNFSTVPGKIAFILINEGLIGFLVQVHMPDNKFIFTASAIVIAAGIFFFLYQVYVIFKLRIRKKLDAALKFSGISYIIMGLAALFAFSFAVVDYSSIMNVTLAYGYIIFYGFISLLIVGQMYKILPFLTWYHKYSSKAGLEKVPMLKDMYNEKIAHYGFYLMLAAIAGVAAGALLDIPFIVFGCFILMLISSILFTFNMIRILVI